MKVPKLFAFAAVAATLLVGLLLSVEPVYATTADLSGQVVDANGDPVVGASVTATNLRTGLARETETDSDGVYRLLALPPAPYKIEVKKESLFAPATEVELRLGQAASLTVTMAEQKLEVVTVTGKPMLNVRDSEVATTIDPEQVRELPTINRDFTDLANLAPGAKPKQTGQLDPTKNAAFYRPVTIGAGNGRETNISIDGGDNNDLAVGTYMMGVTIEAVQEFEVITDQYKVEYGRASHGVINAITRSGSNDLEGTVFGLYRDDGFRRRNFSESLAGVEKSDSERKQYGASIGGPLIKDKLFGFGAYERVEEEAPTAYSPDITGFTRTAPFAGGSFDTGPERDLYTAKLNWNINSRNTAFVRYNLDENEFINDQGGSTTLEPFNGGSTNEGWSILGNWTSVIKGNMINELQVHRIEFENGISSNTPANSLAFITTETYADPIDFTLGRNRNTPQATFIDKTQIRDDFSWSLGRHDLKFGFDYLDIEFDDSLLGLPDLFTVNFVFQTDVDPDEVDAAAGDLGLIDEIFFDNPGFIPGSDYTQYGFYAQDTFRVNDRWSVYYGVRYDKDDGVFDPQKEGINRTLYEAIAASAKVDAPKWKNVFPEDPDTWSPRAGFVYRVKGGDTDVIRGSFGIFHDKVIENLTIFSAQNLSPVFEPSLPNLDCDAGDCLAGFDLGVPGVAPLPADFSYENWLNPASGLQEWNADNVAALGPLSTIDGQQVFIPSPDWEMPGTRSYSLSWGHSFNADWAMDLTALYSDGFRQYRIWDVRGIPGSESRNTGVQPASTASREYYFRTNGRTEYTALQGQLRAQKPKYSLVFNVNLSRAEGEQDSGASANESGTLDIFSGGNLRYTGTPSTNASCNSATPHGAAENFRCVMPDGTDTGNACTSDQDCLAGETCEAFGFAAGPTCPSSEFGPISGDQTIWASASAIYRLPLGFSIGGDVSYGSDIAFWPNAGFDQNNDGFNSGSEYLGSAGGGTGDSFFAMNLRATKNFSFGRDVGLNVFLEVFNVTNTDNIGLFVSQRQATADGSANPDYLTPTGNFLGDPRTINAGFRLTY